MATGVKFYNAELNDFIAKKQTTHPELSAEWLKLEELYNKKLWHQLTLKVQELVEKPTMQTGDNLITLYTNFVSYFENKINPLSLVEIIAHVMKQYTNKKEAIAFLEKIEGKVKANDEALALCKVLQGQIYLEQLNDLDATEKIIEQLEGSLEDADGVTPVHGRFYKLASEYYRVRGPMAKYYRSALRYVGCAGGGAGLAPEERRATALRTPDAWACELVKAVASGDVALFEKVRASAHHPDLARTDRQLRQKIAILCLMELTFAEIAREARVPIDEVELLVMKALAEKLIRGHIDQAPGSTEGAAGE
ncbi:hypothetical protein HF086_001425 [Spodoptera exigua]|uniref:26S proteasome non-ATPase regulatory subunit 13 n=1 Tax=Spodoptera exigua TaxID=7107 RepID=A0A922M755_SPOEX|nr:hypothetical protein HF086_001425 [Spodoptera exigua]